MVSERDLLGASHELIHPPDPQIPNGDLAAVLDHLQTWIQRQSSWPIKAAMLQSDDFAGMVGLSTQEVARLLRAIRKNNVVGSIRKIGSPQLMTQNQVRAFAVVCWVVGSTIFWFHK